MIIGYVAEPYEESGASGMGYAVRGLLSGLVENPGEDRFVVYSSSPVRKDLVKGEFEQKIIPKNFFSRIFFFLFLGDKIDMLMFTAPFLPLIIPRRIAPVMVCKELAIQKTPFGSMHAALAFIRDNLLMPMSLKRARLILTPSLATKNDLIKSYAVSEDKIRVTYEGFQELEEASMSQAKAFNPAMEPYFFFTGKAKQRKNVRGIVDAFIAFKKRTNAGCRLVISGSAEGTYVEDMKKGIERSGFSKDVFFVGYISPEDLYLFYSYAVALVFPSFSEGFGMPILEAMSLRVPVITSKVSSMAEIAGDAALLVDPYNTDEISRAMERIFTDERLRQDLAERGFNRSKEFSWSKVVAEVRNAVHLLAL